MIFFITGWTVVWSFALRSFNCVFTTDDVSRPLVFKWYNDPSSLLEEHAAKKSQCEAPGCCPASVYESQDSPRVPDRRTKALAH